MKQNYEKGDIVICKFKEATILNWEHDWRKGEIVRFKYIGNDIFQLNTQYVYLEDKFLEVLSVEKSFINKLKAFINKFFNK